MFADGIFPIGDGLLDIDEERLKLLLVPDDINEIYDVEQTPFARGKFAAVRRAIHKNSGVHFAAKFLKRRRRAQSSDREIKHEIAVLMLCNEATNIVKLNAVHESRSDTALLLELATGGELQTFLDNEECLNEAQARLCMREVLNALQFLHKRSIVHLDLKPQNILLTGERIEDGLKLCDFGISRVVTEGTNVREIVGTPDYVAPEVLQYEPLSLATDIWSVGVLTYVLLSGFSPFGGETKQETFLNISQCALTFPDKLFGGVSPAAIDFIRKALRIKPNDRMTAAGCLEHIWLKDECNLDRHIFTNILSNKQQLQHNNDEDDDDDDETDVDLIDVASNGDDEELPELKDKITANGVHALDNEEDTINTNNQEHHDQHNNDVDVNNEVHEDEAKEIVKVMPEALSVEISEEKKGDMVTSSKKRPPRISPKPVTAKNGHGHLNYLSNGHMNGYSKLAEDKLSPKIKSNSLYSNKIDNLPNGSATNSANIKHHTSTTTKTTAIHNVVPPTKAITIPLSSVQHQHLPHYSTNNTTTNTTTTTATTTPQEQQEHHQQQQFLVIPVRRQSSDSNKENTFLTTKEISATPLSGGVISIKNPSAITQSTTATIVINPSVNHNTHLMSNNIVATITLPTPAAMSCTPPPSLNVTNDLKLSASPVSSMITTATTTNSLFPDAPTTPKVIRKAPTTDTSPTSVKALVKKFQLEGGEQPLSPPEFASNGSKPGGLAAHMSPLTASKTNETKTKYINGRTSLHHPPNSHHSTAAISIGNGMRRASEPIAAIHHSAKKLVGGGMVSSSAPAPLSIPAASASNSFKSSCVYCSNTCSASKTITAVNGCRHPPTLSTSPSAAAHKNGGFTSASCSTNFSQSTKSLINGSSSNGSLTSSSSNGTSNSNASSNALLYSGNHQQQQQQQQQHHLHSHHHGGHYANHHLHHHHSHHHLHHHAVAGVKSTTATANGLSLDQGIIC